MMKFDPAATFIELTMVRYFEESLKPSIKAKINQNVIHLDNYEELIAKAIRDKVKTGLRRSFFM